MDVRLILDPPAVGSVNMAVDEALLESAGRGETVLRFYAWSPATLSLGYFQQYADRRLHPASANLDIVRRSTGGGAIVHDQELTYSFVTPISQRFSDGHQQLVRAFHVTLCESLAAWQVAANLHRSEPSDPPRNRQLANDIFLCFQRRAIDDVVSGGAKIAGSAQRRRRTAILQHGSVLLAKSLHAPELPGIGDFTKHPPNPAELIEVWTGKIAAHLGISLWDGKLTDEELKSAENRGRTKYATEDWQHRR